MSVRVRFAPSPTGPLHIGGVRTALYNYLFAKKHNGDFLLRIEDTDQNRYVPGAEEYIIESLKWCGIKYNEGVGIGGKHEPYRQSERKEIYKQYAEMLVEKGYAYYAFDTSEELDKLRKEYEKRKETFQYNYITRKTLNNSLNFPHLAPNTLLPASNTQPYVIRIRIPENENVQVTDIIRGEVNVHSSQLDDKVLFKSDGMPTYHLANVVDDYLMQITHVIRGEEWLPSAPLHVLLYRYLGWEAKMPQFAHLPLLLKPDGNGKLSKRDGDRLGFPVFPLKWNVPGSDEVYSGYREAGYLPEAFVNILTFLGWNPGTEQEIFSMEELVKAFSLDRVGKHGAKFDPEKAKWYNHQYLMKMDNPELARLFKPILNQHLAVSIQHSALNFNDDYIIKVCGIFKKRINFIGEFFEKASYMFVSPTEYDPKAIKEKWNSDSPLIIKSFADYLSVSAETSILSENIGETFDHFIDEKQLNKGQLMPLLRIAIIGNNKGPDMNEIIPILGRDEVISRINRALLVIKS